MSVDAATIRRMAKLSRIAVAEDQIAPLTAEASRILAWADQLQDVDVNGVEPMAVVAPLRLKRRDDRVTEGDAVDDILGNAPETSEGFFVVPRVVE